MDNEGNIYVTGRVRRSGGGGYNDFAVIKYNNSGIEQWKSYYDGPESFDDDPINISIDQNRNVYVCGEINPNGGSHFKFTVVKFNSDGSFDWEYIYDENVSSRAFGVWVDNSGNVYAAGDGEGANGNQDLMAVKLSETSGVEDNGSSVNEFVLFQNYPNPFNPSTVIKYSIPDVIASGAKQSQLITLKVYDVLGNDVATVVDEYKPAGSYEVEFSADDLTSGIYFYKLHAGSYSETKKMILMR
jgi:Secretion system C-terminal sorting domain